MPVDDHDVFVVEASLAHRLRPIRAPADFSDIAMIMEHIIHPAIFRSLSGSGADALVSEHQGKLSLLDAVRVKREHLAHDIRFAALLVGIILPVAHDIAEWRCAGRLSSGGLLGHAAHNLGAEVDEVILIRPFDDALDQRSEMPLGDRLRDGHNGDASLLEQILQNHALFLISCETRELPHIDHVEGVRLLLRQRDHALKVVSLFCASSGDAVVIKYIFVRDHVAFSLCMLPDFFQLAVGAVFVLSFVGYADICRSYSE